jgi:hypothetical protein
MPSGAGGAGDCRLTPPPGNRGWSPGDARCGSVSSFGWPPPSCEARSEPGGKRARREGSASERVPCRPLLSFGSQRWRGSVRKWDHIGSVPEMALSLWEPPQPYQRFRSARRPIDAGGRLVVACGPSFTAASRLAAPTPPPNLYHRTAREHRSRACFTNRKSCRYYLVPHHYTNYGTSLSGAGDTVV